MAVVLRAQRQLAAGPRAVGRDQPERLPVAIEPGRDGLERDDGEAAVRRETRFGGDPQAVQVVGAGRARHGDPPAVGTPEV